VGRELEAGRLGLGDGAAEGFNAQPLILALPPCVLPLQRRDLLLKERVRCPELDKLVLLPLRRQLL
jgi:hypothetical protein